MRDIEKTIESQRIIPLVTYNNEAELYRKCEKLIEQGMKCIEIGLRSLDAIIALKNVITRYTDMIFGAGTVMTSKQADEVIDVGAKFIFSPGLLPSLVEHCAKKEYIYFPGCATPGEIMQSCERNFTTVKLFPIKQLGGVGFVRAMTSVFTNVNFIPTGGIDETDSDMYLMEKNVIAVGGSWLSKEEMQWRG